MLKLFPCLLALSGCGAFLMDSADFVPRSQTPRCTILHPAESLYANDQLSITLYNNDGNLYEIRYTTNGGDPRKGVPFHSTLFFSNAAAFRLRAVARGADRLWSREFATNIPAGNGTEHSPWFVATAAQLHNVRSNLSGHFRQTADITALPAWQPVGTAATPFTGVYDGYGFLIAGMAVDSPGGYGGLFGSCGGAVLRDIQLSNARVVAAGDNAGLLCGHAGAGTLLSGCHASGVVTNGGYEKTGGLVGHLEGSSTLSNCHFHGTVRGYGTCGGIAGRNSMGYIDESKAQGMILGYSDTGGLVGNHEGGLIRNCYASMVLFCTNANGGGLVGYCSASIADSAAFGSVTSFNPGGGFVGYLQAGTISGCFSSNTVTGTDGGLGGFVGIIYDGSIADCYALGSVNGGASANSGGFVAEMMNAGSINRCYAAGPVSGTATIGAFLGFYITGFIADCYANTNTAGTNLLCGFGNPSGIHGLSTVQMQQQTYFTNWDFSTVWTIQPGTSYPYLRWQGDADIPRP